MKQNRKKEKILLITCILFHYIYLFFILYYLFYIIYLIFQFYSDGPRTSPRYGYQSTGERRRKEKRIETKTRRIRYVLVRTFIFFASFFFYSLFYMICGGRTYCTRYLFINMLSFYFSIFDVSSYIVSFCKNILFNIQFKYFIVLYYFNIFFQYFVSFYLLNII